MQEFDWHDDIGGYLLLSQWLIFDTKHDDFDESKGDCCPERIDTNHKELKPIVSPSQLLIAKEKRFDCVER